MVPWPSGKAKVCKTFIRQFKSGRYLHLWCSLLMQNPKSSQKSEHYFLYALSDGKCLKFTDKMLTRIFGFPLMQLSFQKRLEPFESVKEAIWAAPFLISSEISKRAQLFYRVFRILSFENQPGILGRRSLENPGFFYFQKGRWLSAPDSRPFSCFREDGFFAFSHYYSVTTKGRRRNGG